MSKRQLLGVALGAVLLTLGVAAPAAADGIVVPDPPPCEIEDCPPVTPMRQLAIEHHDVDVTIEAGVASTRVDQIFRNDNDHTVEGIYIFPIPPGAAVDDFRLWIDGEPVQGEILSQEEARRRYEEIVRRLKDPALLEYVDGGAFQASIFPIDPGDTRRIELAYSQILTRSEDLLTYRYPLNTEKFSTQPLERVSISIHGEARAGVGAIYSPSHDARIERRSSDEFSVTYEAHDVRPDRDFILHYSVDERELDVSLLSFRDPLAAGEDGTFLLLVAPDLAEEDQQPVAKDVILVLDQSGSMDGEKFEQAQEAARFVLRNLNSEDRFGLLAFSSSLQVFQRDLARLEQRSAALRWLNSLSAQGATDINRALLEAVAMAEGERPTYLLFLTDGLPTEGVTESEEILANLATAAPASVRLFGFGVGHDVDTYLLDSLTADHSGASTYVRPNDPIDEAISGLYAKLDAPVLTDLELSFDGSTARDLQPRQLPDLFDGSQLVVLGRYADPGEVTVALTGHNGSGARTFEYGPFELRAEGGADYLPRLWATRKVGSLLRQIRLEGANEELVEQVVALSIRYGIVTPYTSYLVTEPNSLTRQGQEQIVGETLEEMAAPQAVSGEEAVERAAAEADIAEAGDAGQLEGEAAELIRWVGDRTFRLTDGVWIDTAFDASTGEPIQVQYLSPAYFELVDRSERLAAAFALGPRVIALAGGTSYEVVGEGGTSSPQNLPGLPRPTEESSSVSSLPAGPAKGGPPADDQGSLPRGAVLPCPGLTLPAAFGVFLLHRERRRA